MASSDDVFRWVNKADTNGMPVGAVTRDCLPEGNCNYAIRVNGIVGNYEEGKDYVEYESYGCKTSTNWDYLVSNEDVTGMGIIPTIIYSIIMLNQEIIQKLFLRN